MTNRRQFLQALSTTPALAVEPNRIDRQAMVTRHNILTDKSLPLQVGNGEFAFSADVTGLQTFVPFATMSHWGWHSTPPPDGMKPEDFRGEVWTSHGREIEYPIGKGPLANWLAANPHRLNLGRIGLVLLRRDGSEAVAADIGFAQIELDLWRGLLRSRFEFDGEPVRVETVCHPSMDAVAVRVESRLIASGRVSVRIAFPYGDLRYRAEHVGDWASAARHETRMKMDGDGAAAFQRTLDGDGYNVRLRWTAPATLRQEKPHTFRLAGSDALEFACLFEKKAGTAEVPSFHDAKNASAEHWPRFWNSGGAVDLSASNDPRWRELERRVVLSQYLMAVNEAGSWPPQEAGLVNNGWHGRFHFEMYFWHGAHYALWNRWPLLERSLDVYTRFLESSKQRAKQQGFQGARWPKCTADNGREWPHPIHALLIWQQPHPMFFAELDYRAHPSRKTLDKWREVLFQTANFMASYAFRESDGRYVLGPPLYPVSENTKPKETRNPAFELSYWRFGLRIAQSWRQRLGMKRHPDWERVLRGLAPLPVQDGVYVLHEGIADMWTKFNFEHPALIGTYGVLPGDGVDVPTLRRTLARIDETWKFERTWGWDFPMLAMAAARLGQPEKAIDFLLHKAPGFQFNEAGLATGGPWPYFPSNGALLYAVAMMAAGWDGAPKRNAPGFPEKWRVRVEGLARAI